MALPRVLSVLVACMILSAVAAPRPAARGHGTRHRQPMRHAARHAVHAQYEECSCEPWCGEAENEEGFVIECCLECEPEDPSHAECSCEPGCGGEPEEEEEYVECCGDCGAEDSDCSCDVECGHVEEGFPECCTICEGPCSCDEFCEEFDDCCELEEECPPETVEREARHPLAQRCDTYCELQLQLEEDLELAERGDWNVPGYDGPNAAAAAAAAGPWAGSPPPAGYSGLSLALAGALGALLGAAGTAVLLRKRDEHKYEALPDGDELE